MNNQIIASDRFKDGDRVELKSDRMIHTCKPILDKWGIKKGATGTVSLVPNPYYMQVTFDCGYVARCASPKNFRKIND